MAQGSTLSTSHIGRWPHSHGRLPLAIEDQKKNKFWASTWKQKRWKITFIHGRWQICLYSMTFEPRHENKSCMSQGSERWPSHIGRWPQRDLSRRSVVPDMLNRRSVLTDMLSRHSVLTDMLSRHSVVTDMLSISSVVPDMVSRRSVMPVILSQHSVVPDMLSGARHAQ